jgi:hypothetical protein
MGKQKNDNDSGDKNKGFQSASKKVGGQPAPRIGGKIAKGDSRSKSMNGNIKPSKGC